MIQFDSIPSQYDDDIDNTFFEWCRDNLYNYWNDETEYPLEFKQYYIKNVYPYTLQEEIAY